MKASILATVATCIPMLLSAQQVSATASASAQATIEIPDTYSAESRSKIESAFTSAREKNLPDQPMRDRMAEGAAKGATEAQIVTVVTSTRERLEASQQALIRAGRANPQPAEIINAEQAMVGGATEVQIESIVKATPAGEPLVFGATGAVNAGVSGAANAVKGAVNGAVTGSVPPKKP